MRVLAIASSIGGTGKTTTSIALASAFQQFGCRTVLIDLDISLGNIERLIGAVRLGPDLLDVIDSTEMLATEVPPEELLVIPSSRMLSTQTLKPQQIQRLFETCEALGFDYIIWDLPPGLGEPVLRMANLADDIIVTSPADRPLTCTVSPLLHRLRAERSRSGDACRLHLLITRGTSQPGTPNTLQIDQHFLDRDQLTLLGCIPEVDTPQPDSGSADMANTLLDEGVLTAYVNRSMQKAQTPRPG